MWKQSNFDKGNPDHRRGYSKYKHLKKLKSLAIILLLLISTSIIFIKTESVRGALSDLPAISVEPTYIAGKLLDIIEVKFNIRDSRFMNDSDVSAWQIYITWTSDVLEMDSTIVWGDFMDGYRIGEWGLLLYDAAAGQNEVFVTDSTKYQAGYPVLIQDDFHQETNTVIGVLGTKLTLETNLVYSYSISDNAGCYADPDETPGPWIDNGAGYAIVALSTDGVAAGVEGDGWLATVRFLVQQNANTLLNIDSPNTVIVNTELDPVGDEPGELIKESGYFLSMYPEDAKPDGLIDVFDIYTVGKDWQKCPKQQRNPTTTSGGWTNGANAYMTDNLRASAINNAQQVYGGFGFSTTSWSGVSKVEVGVERRSLSGLSDDTLRVEISNNGGTSWAALQNNTVINWLNDRFEWLDFTAAYAWTPSGVANIAVRISYVRGAGTEHEMQVDWVTVRVTPTPTAISMHADVNADSIVNTPDLALQAADYGFNYRP